MKYLQYFNFLAPQAYLNKINPDEPNDPLLKQVQVDSDIDANDPEEEEGDTHLPYTDEFSPVPGLIHKYRNRATLLLTDRCCIHCRFCFRRKVETIPMDFLQVHQYLTHHPEINEVILSGGDPLYLDIQHINEFLKQIELIPTIKTIQIQSRLVIVAPKRLNIAKLYRPKQSMVLITHCNHPRELDEDNRQLLARFLEQDYLLLNQSILLHGVNDQPGILIKLSRQLFDFHVLPYYLRIMHNKSKEAKKFMVPENQARLIYGAMQQYLPGYLLPKLVKASPTGKIFLSA